MKETDCQSIFFLINPCSGGRQAIAAIRNLKRYAANQQSLVEVAELNLDRLADQIAKARTYNIIVIGGGDGTISTLLPLLEGVESSIGILPLGTGNDLARELGLIDHIDYTNPNRLIEFYRAAPVREITRFNLEYGEHFSSRASFVNYISFGFDAKVVAEFARLRETKFWRSFKGVWGNRLGYAATCIWCLEHRLIANPPFAIKTKDSSQSFASARSVIFTNIRSVMGMGKSNLHSSAFDENVECIVVNNVIHYLAMLSHYKLPVFPPHFVGSAQTWDIIDLPANVHIQIDGEPRPDISSESYRISLGAKVPMIVG